MDLNEPNFLAFWLVGVSVLGCHAKGPNGAAVEVDASADAPVSSPMSSSTTSDSGAPPIERACNTDADCAVAIIEVDGDRACCASCGTTPGTKRWYADLQRFCGRRAPANCGALACPMGPTRAVCNRHVCEATADGVDGGPALVLPERRCTRALVCGVWAGCTLVTGDTQNGYFVYEHDRVPRGEGATLDRVCTGDAGCFDAARLPCAPTTAPRSLDPPSYSCRMGLGRCAATP